MPNIETLAKIIWDYMLLNQSLKKVDCILALGSNDTRVAERAVELYKNGFAPIIIFSGNSGILTKDIFNKPEAEIFEEIAVQKGVPKEKIYIENRSMNTGENVEFTKKLIELNNLNINSFILVQKPYMERRTYATFKKVWPEKDFLVTSPQINFDDYFTEDLSKDLIINILVGDLQRIKVYYEKGFQIYQEIPEDVWTACEKLVNLGYNKHLIETVEKNLKKGK